MLGSAIGTVSSSPWSSLTALTAAGGAEGSAGSLSYFKPAKPFLNKTVAITRRRMISTPCPTSVLTTEIVSGLVEIKIRLIIVAIAIKDTSAEVMS